MSLRSFMSLMSLCPSARPLGPLILLKTFILINFCVFLVKRRQSFMVHIKIHKGLNIPIKGEPTGSPKLLIPGGGASPLTTPQHIGLDLSCFEEIKFKVLVRLNDKV